MEIIQIAPETFLFIYANDSLMESGLWSLLQVIQGSVTSKVVKFTLKIAMERIDCDF